MSHATRDFDVAIREALEAIVGSPISDWALLKASLPSSRGGVNLRSACLHAPAAFVASSVESQNLVESMLDFPPCRSPDLDAALSALSSAASQPHWQSLDDIDVRYINIVCLRLLMRQFTNSSLSQLHLLVPVPWLSRQLYLMLVIG